MRENQKRIFSRIACLSARQVKIPCENFYCTSPLKIFPFGSPLGEAEGSRGEKCHVFKGSGFPEKNVFDFRAAVNTFRLEYAKCKNN